MFISSSGKTAYLPGDETVTVGISIMAVASAVLAFVRPSIPAYFAAAFLNSIAAYLFLSVWFNAVL